MTAKRDAYKYIYVVCMYVCLYAHLHIYRYTLYMYIYIYTYLYILIHTFPHMGTVNPSINGNAIQTYVSVTYADAPAPIYRQA